MDTLKRDATHRLSLESLNEDSVEKGLERSDRLEGSGLGVSFDLGKTREVMMHSLSPTATR